MTLLKPLKHENMLIPYEQFYIQSLHQACKLSPKQYPGKPNPLFQLAIHPLHTTRQSQSSNIQQHNLQLHTRPTTFKPKVCTSYFLVHAVIVTFTLTRLLPNPLAGYLAHRYEPT
jgi:hypothetical protein